MDIGFLNKEQLQKIIMNNYCQTQEDREICKAFFTDEPEKFLIDVFHDNRHNENEKQKYIQQNQNRLLWLTKCCATNILSQAINKDFKGKIVVNGDLYSDRLIVFLMNCKEHSNWPNPPRTISCEQVKQSITDVNTLCYNLLKILNDDLNSNEEDENVFLIAGNHDLYASDVIKKNYTEVDCLEELKNNTLKNLSLLKFAKFKKGDKTIVFKHSPHLSKKDLERIKSNESQHIRDKTIREYINDFKEYKELKHSYYWKYANDKLYKNKVDEKTIFCYDEHENEEVNKQLQENDYYMVFGHCGITASNSSTYSIIDKDWDNYRYSKFLIDKNKQLKHKVYDGKNQITQRYKIKNFENIKKTWTKEKKFDTKKLVPTSNDRINFQQQKNFNVLEVEKQEEFSINNNGLKKEQSTQTEHEMNFQYQSRPSLNNVDKSNSCFNSCWDKIYNICG